MKSRLLLISAILAASAGLGVGTAQASQADAQAQAAALLSSSHVAASPSDGANPTSNSAGGDAQAQAAALLSGVRADQAAIESVQIPSSRAERSLDAQAQAAALLSGTRTPVTAQTSATTEKLGDHPAVVAARTSSTRGIDPNTFIVGHPAGVQVNAVSPTENAEIQAALATKAGR
jgi:hypothetical protein